jgi:hypothetical protein
MPKNCSLRLFATACDCLRLFAIASANVGRGGALADCGPSPPAAAYCEEPGVSTTRFTNPPKKESKKAKNAMNNKLQPFLKV